mmetsp:Transcript_9700/g.20695  ORF Transcript_9700/g.20695 Transcript_9700/m.20695 type:complete len:92 (+) Transcript_9700:163-438(+)
MAGRIVGLLRTSGIDGWASFRRTLGCGRGFPGSLDVEQNGFDHLTNCWIFCTQMNEAGLDGFALLSSDCIPDLEPDGMSFPAANSSASKSS